MQVSRQIYILTKEWAKYFFKRMGFIKREGNEMKKLK